METLKDELIQLLETAQPVNPQLYPNSDLPGSAVEQELLASKDALHNTKLPNFAIIHEKPEHRLIVYLKSQGLTNREIAKRTDYTESWISQITRQPWFQIRLLDVVKESGGETVEQYLRAQLEPSVIRLVHLRDHAVSEAVQLGATTQLLDRFLGKPVQRTESKVEVTKREDRKLSIDEELKELAAAEAKLLTQLGERAGADVTASAVVHPPVSTLKEDK